MSGQRSGQAETERMTCYICNSVTPFPGREHLLEGNRPGIVTLCSATGETAKNLTAPRTKSMTDKILEGMGHTISDKSLRQEPHSSYVPRRPEARPDCNCNYATQGHLTDCPAAHQRDAVPALDDRRIEILASRAGGHCVGAPATRDEERAMAVEIQSRRAAEQRSAAATPCPECGGTGTVEEDATGALGYVVNRPCPTCSKGTP